MWEGVTAKNMKNKVFRTLVGSFILISLILAVKVNINWLWFTAFIGVNLIQSAFTNWCLLETILTKIGLKDSK